MQTYPLKLSPTKDTEILHVQADLFVYESGDASVGDTRIKVKPENGAEIVLRPGQRFRIVDTAQRWIVSLFDTAADLTANIIIGSGEFDDANTLNTFKLDATFANNVKVTNAGAGQAIPITAPASLPVSVQGGPLPVSIQNLSLEIANDSGNRLPVTLDPNQVLNTMGNSVAYTTSYASTVASVTNTAIQLLSPAANVNGAWLNAFTVIPGQPGVMFSVLAKATAPANIADGDVLYTNYGGSGQKYQLDIGKDGQVRVPAGKGIWYIANANDGAYIREALMTVL
jgi:hypothetical protein